jgi:hypothetical protein
MSDNPYASPSLTADKAPRGLFLYLVAIACWLLAILPLVGIVVIIGDPKTIARFQSNPILATTVTLVGFGCPSLGLALLGLASWRRSLRLLVAAFGGFLPLVLWIVVTPLWRR